MRPSLEKRSLVEAVISTTGSSVAVAVLLRTLFHELAPTDFKKVMFETLGKLYTHLSSQLTMVIQEFNDLTTNQIYSAAEIYLHSKRLRSAKRLIVSKDDKQKSCALSTEHVNDVVVDDFEGIHLKWKFIANETGLPAVTHRTLNHPSPSRRSNGSYFELTFHKRHKEKVLNSYLPHILNISKTFEEENKVIKLYTTGDQYIGNGSKSTWSSVALDHPVTFDKLAMDNTLKKTIIDDLERFVKRKEFYKRVGKPWKRGYLLYGPPGTGKSSLVAAMANYLKFDIYDLELTDMRRNSDFKRLFLSTANRSILVVEDIDCSFDFKSGGGMRTFSHPTGGSQQNDQQLTQLQLTLSGMLNFMDGLWSSCGDERIIVLTTNNKDKLDPALLRPGRIDMHINMSYCTPCGFKLLAYNYLQLSDHPVFRDVEELLEKTNVTPAEVAEQLMKTDDPDITLEELVRFLHEKC